MKKRFAITAMAMLALLMMVQPLFAAERTATSISMPRRDYQCFEFREGMKIGDSGTDVSGLQDALRQTGLYDGGDRNGYFGEHTASAITAFQEQYSWEVLEQYGLAHGTGYVSKATADKLDELYGCKKNLPPVIYSVSGPSELSTGESGTWSISARDPEGKPLTYSVNWGDEPYYGWNTDEAAKSTSVSYQASTFTHSYANPGTYTIKFVVTDQEGLSAESTMTVQVSSASGSGSAKIYVTADDGTRCAQPQIYPEKSDWKCGPWPATGAQVTLYGPDGYVGTEITDYGNAFFSGLRPGDYSVYASYPGFQPSWASFRIDDGETEYVEIRLTRAIYYDIPYVGGGIAYVDEAIKSAIAPVIGVVSAG